jgi:hypothetical protein
VASGLNFRFVENNRSKSADLLGRNGIVAEYALCEIAALGISESGIWCGFRSKWAGSGDLQIESGAIWPICAASDILLFHPCRHSPPGICE